MALNFSAYPYAQKAYEKQEKTVKMLDDDFLSCVVETVEKTIGGPVSNKDFLLTVFIFSYGCTTGYDDPTRFSSAITDAVLDVLEAGVVGNKNHSLRAQLGLLYQVANAQMTLQELKNGIVPKGVTVQSIQAVREALANSEKRKPIEVLNKIVPKLVSLFFDTTQNIVELAPKVLTQQSQKRPGKPNGLAPR